MKQPVYIVDIFRGIVAATSAALLTQLQAADPLITGVHFDYGHYTDIRNRITAKEGNPAEKQDITPLIALFEDFRITKGQAGIFGIAGLKFIILHSSDKGYTRQQREDLIFRPILYPVYWEFLRQIKLSGKFMYYGTELSHDQINRPHWGDPELYGNKGYLLNRVLDGIELDRIELKTYLPNC